MNRLGVSPEALALFICKQVYNHFLHRLNRIDDTSAYSEQRLLPSLKTW